MAQSRNFARACGTAPIGQASVRFVTAPISAGDDPWGGEPDVARATRAPSPEAPQVHRRFDPAIAQCDGLARIAAAISSRQQAMASQAGPGRAVRLRQVLELDALRAAEHGVRDFDGSGLPIVTKVMAANLLQDISLLDPASPTFREDLFRLRQRLYAVSAGCVPDERLLGTACMAIRVLEDAARRMLSGRPEPTPGTILDEHAILSEEQRVHAIVGLLNALGKVKLVGLDRDGAEAVIQLLRRVDPQAFGFDPRNQRFVRHMGDLIGRVSEFGQAA